MDSLGHSFFCEYYWSSRSHARKKFPLTSESTAALHCNVALWSPETLPGIVVEHLVRIIHHTEIQVPQETPVTQRIIITILVFLASHIAWQPTLRVIWAYIILTTCRQIEITSRQYFPETVFKYIFTCFLTGDRYMHRDCWVIVY